MEEKLGRGVREGFRVLKLRVQGSGFKNLQRKPYKDFYRTLPGFVSPTSPLYTGSFYDSQVFCYGRLCGCHFMGFYD